MASISIPTAIIGSAALSTGGSLLAGSMQSGATKDASRVQQAMFDATRQDLSPYMGAGKNALTALLPLLGLKPDGTFDPNAPLAKSFTAADYTKSPGYDFQMKEGLNAITNSAAAKGGVFSGNTLKALTGYGQGLAGQDYWNAYNAFRANQGDLFSRLSGVVSTGQNAAAGVGNAGIQTGQNIGNNIIGGGNAGAAGIVGATNALSGGANSLAQLAFLSRLSGGGLESFAPSGVRFATGDSLIGL